MSSIGRCLALLGALSLLLAAPAAGAPATVPPGHSGASQYTETLPAAGGEQATSELAGGGGGGGGTDGGGDEGGASGGAEVATPGEVLGSKHAKRLEKLGPEGKAAARLAADGGAVSRQTGGLRDTAGGSSPVKQVVGELTGTSDSGGMGLLLPLLIAMTALVAVAFILTRRRPAGPGE